MLRGIEGLPLPWQGALFVRDPVGQQDTKSKARQGIVTRWHFNGFIGFYTFDGVHYAELTSIVAKKSIAIRSTSPTLKEYFRENYDLS